MEDDVATIVSMPQATNSNQPQGMLTKENTSCSSAKRRTGTQLRNRQSSKLYQPKYPSQGACKRQPRHVLVPKPILEARKLSDGDRHQWVEHKAAIGLKSSGWITGYKSLEEQGYHQGNRKIWVSKPKFEVYEIPSKAANTVRNLKTQHTLTAKTRYKKGNTPKSTRNYHKDKKDPQSKPQTPQSTKKWIPKRRLQDQGYYEGASHIWLPKKTTTVKPYTIKGLATPIEWHTQSSTQQYIHTLQWKKKSAMPQTINNHADTVKMKS